MTSKFVRSLLAIAVVSLIVGLTMPVPAQSAGANPPAAGNLPAAPSASAANPSDAPAKASTPPVIAATGTGKIGTINMEYAVGGTNEGRRDFEALDKKLEPKGNELKAQKDELDNLQKQLQTQGDKLNDDARATLVKQIETKKKSFERSYQDFQEDGQNQQKEIFQRILSKMAPVIVKYAQDNGFAMIVDTSNPWPQSPILWYGEAGDITKAVVDLYNEKSGVPAPAAPGAAAKPAAQKPPATKPATPPAQPPK